MDGRRSGPRAAPYRAPADAVVPLILLRSAAALLMLFATAVPARDLLGVYQDALQADPQIRQAEANRRAARETRPQAWANLLPQLEGTAAMTRNHAAGTQGQFLVRPSGGFGVVPLQTQTDASSHSWALNLRQNLFSWSHWMQLKAAGSQVAQAEANYQAAEQNLIQRVAQTYFNVLTAVDNLEAQQASLEAIARQLDQAQRRFEVGLIAITDVEEARAARDTAAAAVIAAKRSLATAEDQLEEITGRRYDELNRPGDDMPLAVPEPADPDRWVQISLEQNASLVATRLAADIARDDVQLAFGGHLPSLDLLASRTYTHGNANEVIGGVPFNDVITRSNDRQYSLQITMPIFSGGATQSRVRQTQYQWLAAKEAVVQVSRATERQARDAYLGVIAGVARVRALRQALQSSRISLHATEAGYEVGTRTAVDVLNARRALVQAQTDYSGSRYDYMISMVALRLAAGTLDRTQIQSLNGLLGETVPTASPMLTPESLPAPAPGPGPQVPLPPATVTPPAGAVQPPGRQSASAPGSP